jgi:DNA-directed RNA polymerase specialized sigma24 family protein
MPDPIIARLNAEWENLAAAPPDWPTRHGTTLAAVLAAVREQPDAVLGELIAASRHGSALAGRTALQSFLGKAVRLAHDHRDVTVGDAVAAFWLRLAHYPLDRRPAKIALNLRLDVLRDLRRDQRPLRPLTPAPPPDDDPAAVLAAARDLDLDPACLIDVATSVYSDGLTSARAAVRHRLTPQAVRWRCHDTVRRLRQARHLLADAGLPTHPVAWVVA